MTVKKKSGLKRFVIKNNTFTSTGPTLESVRAAQTIASACLENAQALRHAAETLNVRAPGLVITR